MIFVEPMLGLCNRIRVIDSVLAMNHERSHRVWLLWLRDPDLNCRFDELFERPAGVDAVFDFAVESPPGRILKYLLPRVLQNVVSRAIHQNEMDRLLVNGFAFADLLPLRSVYLRTWDRFYSGANPLSEFRPVPTLRAVVDGYAVDRTRTVGVHIRRTDSPWRADSPMAGFVRLMEEEISRQPDAFFFVSTDSPEEEDHLKRLFQRRIISHQKRSLNRNSPGGIKDALVDLYCLARCGKIIGSHRSSFSEAAAQIGRCQLVVAQ
jgi:hypothetical protein